MLTNWPVSIWYEFLHKRIFETEMWILIPIILRNMFNLHTKKIYSKYDKICVFEKCPHENYHGEKKSWAEWPEISLLFSKSMPWLSRVYIGSFFNLYMPLPWYHQDGKLMKQYIFETFTSCSQINVPRILGILAPYFQTRKNETKWQGTWSMLQWPSVNVATR